LDSETGQSQGLLTKLPVSRVDPVRLRSADEHPRSLSSFMGLMVSPCERKKSMNFYNGRASHVPLFGTWVLGCSDPTLNFFPKNKKGRNPGFRPKTSSFGCGVPQVPVFGNWVLGFPLLSSRLLINVSTLSEARFHKSVKSGRGALCARSIEPFEGGRWRLRRMRASGCTDLTAMGIESFFVCSLLILLGLGKPEKTDNRS